MSFLCPVCNGLEALVASCSRCGAAAIDAGRLTDFYGPYAPYRPMDDLRLTNGLPDLAQHECVHVLHCPQCGQHQQMSVSEQAAY